MGTSMVHPSRFGELNVVGNDSTIHEIIMFYLSEMSFFCLRFWSTHCVVCVIDVGERLQEKMSMKIRVY